MTRGKRMQNVAKAGLCAFVFFAILWGLVWLLGAWIPATERIKGIGDLSFPVSRGWDILAAPLLAGLVTFSLSFKDINGNLHEEIELSLSWGVITIPILWFLFGVVPAFVIIAIVSAIAAITAFMRGEAKSRGRGVLVGFSLAFACCSGLIYGFLPGLIMGKAVFLASLAIISGIAVFFSVILVVLVVMLAIAVVKYEYP